MATLLSDSELDAALAQIALEQDRWFASRRAELAAHAAQRKRDLDARSLVIKAIGRHLDESVAYPDAICG